MTGRKDGHHLTTNRTTGEIMNKSLAEWANEQPMFKAFAAMRGGCNTMVCHSDKDAWIYFAYEDNRGDIYLGWPPSDLCGSLKLDGKKWIDA